MSDVVSQLEKMFEEEKALKGDRDETGAGAKKGVKPSDRAQTARQFEEEEDADEAPVEDGRTGTWAGGRKGIAHDDDSPPVRARVFRRRSALGRVPCGLTSRCVLVTGGRRRQQQQRLER
jgi:hypothetical protein